MKKSVANIAEPCWAFASRCPCKDENSKEGNTFAFAFETKIRKSFIACYLQQQQQQQQKDTQVSEEKLSLVEFDMKRAEEKTIKHNDFTDSVLGLLRQAILKGQQVNHTFIGTNLTSLRLVDCKIVEIDESLHDLKALETLSLACNLLEVVRGTLLPKSLRVLELYGNKLTDVRELISGMPAGLLHLGLGKNKLHDGSGLHLLSETPKSELRSLDLEDNDICELMSLLRVFSALPTLGSLRMEGNPCSVALGYKQYTLDTLPRLFILDDIDLSTVNKERQQDFTAEVYTNLSTLQFKAYRVMGLPKQKPVKGTVYQYYVEFVLPRLGGLHTIPTPSIRRDVNRRRSTSPRKSTFQCQTSADDRNIILSTEKFPYMPLFTPGDPQLEITSFDLKGMRDLMQGNTILVRICEDKTVPKKGKKEKVDKTQAKENSSKTSPASGITKKLGGKSEEDVPLVEKTILGQFTLPLDLLTWTGNLMEFAWTDDMDTTTATVTTGNLRDLTYQSDYTNPKAKKVQSAGSKSKEKEKGTPSESPENRKLTLPKLLTCHVGVSLKTL